MNESEIRRFRITLSVREARLLKRFIEYGKAAISAEEHENGKAKEIQNCAEFVKQELAYEFPEIFE